MNKTVLSLVGPTSSGKTSIALSLAGQVVASGKYLGAVIISADSRQVFKGLETLTGADIPRDFDLVHEPELGYPFFKKNTLSIHGSSIIAPNEEWSISHFRELAQQTIAYAVRNNLFPIVVGGTGLYHRRMLSTDPQLQIPPDDQVRQRAAQMALSELQRWAESVDSARFSELNNSDRNNPRRLVRVIEIGQAQANDELTKNDLEVVFNDIEHYFIGLQIPKEELSERITERVAQRIATGVQHEVEQIFNRYKDQGKIPAFSSLGFGELLNYTQGTITREQCLETWAKREISYARRQMTWFKKNEKIAWLEAQNTQLAKSAYQLLENYLH